MPLKLSDLLSNLTPKGTLNFSFSIYLFLVKFSKKTLRKVWLKYLGRLPILQFNSRHRKEEFPELNEVAKAHKLLLLLC